MSSKFIYSEHIPKEILPVIQGLLEKYSYLVPGWAQEIRIYWQSSSPAREDILSGQTLGSTAYRWAQLTICPGFLEESDADREDTIVHELVHVLLWPLSSIYDQMLQYLDDQPDRVKDFIMAQLTERVEGATVDTTTAILKAVKGENFRDGKTLPPVASGKKDTQPPIDHIFYGASDGKDQSPV